LSKSQHTFGQNCEENEMGSRDRPSWLIMATSHHSSHISASPSPLAAPSLNVQYLQSTISSYLPDICTNQGLPPNAENTENLSIICHMHGGRSKSPHRLNKTQRANTLLAKIVKRIEMSSHDQHIIMLTFLAHGHLIPFLALARQLHQTTGFTITIVSTPLNIQYLQSTISSDSLDIHLAELPFCSTDHGLPPNVENTENLSFHNVPIFCHASVTLEAPFRRLVRDIMDKESGGRPPLCIISDMFFGWAVNVAKSVGSVSITFTTCGAYGTAAYISFWLHLPHLHRDCEEFFKLPGFPDSHRFHRSQLSPLAKVTDGTLNFKVFFFKKKKLS
jgi:hypothetical protein